MLQGRKLKNKLEKPKRLLRNERIEQRRNDAGTRYTNTQAKKQKTVSDPTAAGTSATADPCSSGSTDPDTSVKSRNSSRMSAAAACPDTLDTTINSDVCFVCYHTFKDDQLEGNGLE